MSEPLVFQPDSHDNPIQSAMNEIVSAISALNMEPDPLPVPEGKYLSEVDGWAKHAVEHLQAAIQTLNHACKERENLQFKLLQASIKAREAANGKK